MVNKVYQVLRYRIQICSVSAQRAVSPYVGSLSVNLLSRNSGGRCRFFMSLFITEYCLTVIHILFTQLNVTLIGLGY
jgi:hypothetical protein